MDIPQSAWPGVIDCWFERMVNCVQAEGGGGGGGGGGASKTGVDKLVVSVVEKPDSKNMSDPRSHGFLTHTPLMMQYAFCFVVLISVFFPFL